MEESIEAVRKAVTESLLVYGDNSVIVYNLEFTTTPAMVRENAQFLYQMPY